MVKNENGFICTLILQNCTILKEQFHDGYGLGYSTADPTLYTYIPLMGRVGKRCFLFM
jgi:hypothetical protein